MRSSTMGSAIALLLAGQQVDAAAATHPEAPLFPRAISGNGYLSVPVGTVQRQNSGKSKRADGKAFETILQNKDFFYATEIGIGSPPQSVTVLVDTGSSELWVNPDCTTAPSAFQARQCNAFGRYQPNKSKTPPVGPFGGETINYGDPSDESTQTSVNIEYYLDNLAFGDAQIKNQTFGVVSSSEGQSQGIFGLAPDLRGGFRGNQPYSLVLNTMAEQGVIASRVFTLDLRHAEAETGAVIYGGLDRSKFIGSLERMPFVRGIQGEFRLAVTVDSLGITQGKSQSYKLAGDDTNMMLDSGTTLTRMHPSAALPILDALNAQDDGEGYYYVPCSMRTSGGTIDFGFGSKTIRVPFSDFILKAQSSRSQVCYVGLVLTTDQQILGDSVLRAGYFVFDWDNQAVHVAQAANCGKSDIVAVGTGKSAVPDVKGNCKESDAKVTGSSGPQPTGTNGAAVPTSAYTTVYTITSCPAFDSRCQTGRVTTQTFLPAEATGGSSTGGDGDDKDDAAARPAALTLLFVSLGAFAMFFNLL